MPMQLPRRTRREIDLLSPEQVSRILAACSRRAPTGVRNRALIALMYGAGLRVGEAIRLRPKDLDLGRFAVTVQSGKGDKRRVAAIIPDVLDALERWLDRRSELEVDARVPVFCTLARGATGPHPTAPGGTLSREYVARVLKRLARRAGVHQRVHPHALRHSHADLLRRRGFDMEQIRRQLGHASLEITGRYLDHLGSNDLPERMRSIGPVLESAPDAREELGRLIDRIGQGDVERLVALLQETAR